MRIMHSRAGRTCGIIFLSMLLLAALGRGALAAPDAGEDAAYSTGVEHIAVRAMDSLKSARFYARLFGPDVKMPPSPIIANPGSMASTHYWVKAGESYIAVSSASTTNGPPGMDHVALAFGGIDADSMAEKLESLGRRFRTLPYD